MLRHKICNGSRTRQIRGGTDVDTERAHSWRLFTNETEILINQTHWTFDFLWGFESRHQKKSKRKRTER